MSRLARSFQLAASAVLLLGLVAMAGADTGAALRRALAPLGPDHVPSGVLLDRTVILSDLIERDGCADAPPLDAAGLRQILHELTRAADDPSSWPTVARLREAERAGRVDHVIPIALLDRAFHRLRPEAVRDGRLVSPGDAPPGSLTAPGRLFAAAALVERTHLGSGVTFTLPSHLTVTDGALGRLEIDLADGEGWRKIQPDGTVSTSYATVGTKILRLRAPATRRESSFTFEVAALVAPPPTETWPITATIPYIGQYGTGEAFIYLAEGHTALEDPVVVVEGFDLDNSLYWDELYELLNQENLLEDLRASGRDAVVLNFTESTDYIQRNAFVLAELLQQVEAAIAPGLEYPLVGASMGGLVSRYALAYLETDGLGHRVHTFISFDGAQAGGNIPLGLQYWLAFFQGESADAAYLLSRLDTPAARQLLLYHHTDPPGPTGVSDPLRGLLEADLAGLGDWPAQPRLVAVANGSGTGQNQGYAAAAQVIRWEYSSLLVDITGNVWAVPDQTSHVIFDGEINLIWPLPDTYQTVTVQGTHPVDSGPGGWRASMAQMDTTAVPYGDLEALHPNHAFIPTISALALDTDDPFFDIAGHPDLLSLTAFDAVYVPAGNQEHVLITPENKAWLLAEIEGAVTAAPDSREVVAIAPKLLGSHPNPFNPRTRVEFAVPAPGPVRLTVIDARGRQVRILVDGTLSAGRHAAVWQGRDEGGRPVAAGVYLVRLEQNGRVDTGRVVLVK